MLPQPWEPATCRTPQLRRQLWLWLDAVVDWLLTEYVWEATDTIPACWPQHRHLVHQIAVVADQRRRAGHASTSDALEEWHRYNLPAFTERMKSRLRNQCEDGHQAWPAKAATPGTRPRSAVAPRRTDSSHPGGPIRNGCRCCETSRGKGGRPRLGLVDLDTGEINDL